MKKKKERKDERKTNEEEEKVVSSQVFFLPSNMLVHIAARILACKILDGLGVHKQNETSQ